MCMPRLHPEDLKQLIDEVSCNVNNHVTEILSNTNSLNDIKVLTVKDVAFVLQKDKRTIISYIEKKLISARKIGKDWIVTKESLNNFINGTK